MLALRINSEHPALRLRGNVDRLLTDVFDCFDPWAVLGRLGREACPPLNLREDDKNLYAEMDVPGMKMDDLEVSVLDNELAIQGEREAEVEEDGVSYHCRERVANAFSRVVTLPVEVDADNVHATLRDGVLRITLPKVRSATPRKIKVTCAD